MTKNKKPLVISKTELEKKGTRELLSYLNQLHQCEESFDMSDLDNNPDSNDSSRIHFKQIEKWKIAYLNVKSILKNRENIR